VVFDIDVGSLAKGRLGACKPLARSA
jgi:hypothetical protein